MNLDQVMKAKEGSVKGLTGGIAHLFKKNGVTRVEGHGSLAGPNKDRFIARAAPGTRGSLPIFKNNNFSSNNLNEL